MLVGLEDDRRGMGGFGIIVANADGRDVSAHGFEVMTTRSECLKQVYRARASKGQVNRATFSVSSVPSVVGLFQGDRLDRGKLPNRS